jgi:predicted anti-sigma-YlaC factor YlaD
MCLNNVDINGYIDDTLGEIEKNMVREHIEVCPKCKNKFDILNITVKTVKSFDEFKADDSFLDSLMLKIESVHPSFEELSSYADDLSDNVDYISNHLEECEPCETIYQSIKSVSNTVSEMVYDDFALDFVDNLMDKINLMEQENVQVFEVPVEIHVSLADLSAYSDSEKTEVSYKLIQNHLESCQKCNSLYLTLNSLKQTVSNLEKPDVPFDFSRKVINQINNNEKKIINIIPFLKTSGHKISMIAGIVIAGIIVSMSNPFSENEKVQVTVNSEDFLFTPSGYRTDSIEVLSDTQENDTMIQDIGL